MKSAVDSIVSFVGEEVAASFAMRSDDPSGAAWLGDFWSWILAGDLLFADKTGELLPSDEAAETELPTTIVPTDGAN